MFIFTACLYSNVHVYNYRSTCIIIYNYTCTCIHTHIIVYIIYVLYKIYIAHVQKCTYRFLDVTIIFSND